MKPLKPWQDNPITPEQEDLLHSETWEKIRENEVQELRETVQNALQHRGPSKPKRKPKPKRKTWPGTVLEFAHKIDADFRAGKIKARSSNKAFEQACQHWKQSNGKPITPASCRAALAQERRKIRGNPR
jgi:hypothetical protein